MPELIYTSEQALRRSISAKYPHLTMEQKMATFEQEKKHLGLTSKNKLEEFLDKKYENYKKSEEFKKKQNANI
jgi:hypothetical protein